MDARYRNVENPYRYTPGGYHPVEIDDKLHHDRYRILHKLGYGSSATVWLALNEHYGRADAPDLRYVALKIIVANTPPRPAESTILRHLDPPPQGWLGRLRAFFWARRSRYDDISSREFVPALLDEFDILGPNGMHHCIVTEVTGLTLAALKNSEELMLDPLPMELARKTTIQLVKGVAFLHSRGVVHGDLHLGNIALGLPVINSWTVDELYERLGKPSKIAILLDNEDDLPLSQVVAFHSPLKVTVKL